MLSLASGAEAQLRRWSNEVAAGSMSFAEYRDRRGKLLRQVVGSEADPQHEDPMGSTGERDDVVGSTSNSEGRTSWLWGKALFSLSLLAAFVGLLILAYVLKW